MQKRSGPAPPLSQRRRRRIRCHPPKPIPLCLQPAHSTQLFSHRVRDPLLSPHRRTEQSAPRASLITTGATNLLHVTAEHLARRSDVNDLQHKRKAYERKKLRAVSRLPCVCIHAPRCMYLRHFASSHTLLPNISGSRIVAKRSARGMQAGIHCHQCFCFCGDHCIAPVRCNVAAPACPPAPHV